MFVKAPILLLLALAVAACDPEPRPTSSMDPGDLNAVLVTEGGGRWSVALGSDVCVVGEIDDTVRFFAAFPSSEDSEVSWVVIDSTTVDDRDGCVRVVGKLLVPVRATNIEHLAVLARIDQLRGPDLVDRVYGAGCVDVDQSTLGTALERVSPTCE